MKKLSLLGLFLMIFLLSGCQKKHLIIKQDVFTIELGETVSQNILDYLDTSKINEADLNALKEADFTLQASNEQYIDKDGQRYLKLGKYQASITKEKESVTFSIEVQDTTKPILTGLTSIQLPIGESLNYAEYFKASDTNELEDIIFDESQINKQVAGNYLLKVSVKDASENETTLEIPIVYLEVPENKRAVSELVEDGDGKHYTTTLQDKNRFVLMDVPYYNQFSLGAPVGCESVSLYMALRYKGYVSNMDCVSFISTTPRSPDDNPYNGFVGTVFDQHRYDILPAIFPSSLTPWANLYGNALDISGTGAEGVIEQLLQGNPVVVWITAYFNPPEWQTFPWGKGFKNTHTVCLIGYDEATKTIYYNDPGMGANKTIDFDTFKSIYDIQNFGVSIY